MSGYVADQCGLDREKVQFYHRLFANTVSASVPLGMSHAVRNGILKNGDNILIMSASAGVTTSLAKLVYQN